MTYRIHHIITLQYMFLFILFQPPATNTTIIFWDDEWWQLQVQARPCALRRSHYFFLLLFFFIYLFIYAKANMTATSIKEIGHRQFTVRWSHSILTLGLMREKNSLAKVLASFHNGDLITSLPLETW